MELTPFVRAPIVSAGGHDAARWAEGMWFTFPRAADGGVGWLRRLQPSGDLKLPAGDVADVPIDPAAARAVREHAAFTDRPPVSGRLPFDYQRVPGWGRAAIASLVGRWHRGRSAKWAAFPGWPLDLTADLLSDLTALPNAGIRGRTPVVLTHDIDSDEGLKNLLTSFLPIEEAIGARSVSYIVPCAWPIDHAAVEQIVARGHEVGVHGYDHSNRTAFADSSERRAAPGRGAAVCRSIRGRRLSRAFAPSDAGAARRPRRPLSVRQQHSDIGRPVSGSQQRLRDGAAVLRRGDHRDPVVDAARRQLAVSRLPGGGDRPSVDAVRRRDRAHRAARSCS